MLGKLRNKIKAVLFEMGAKIGEAKGAAPAIETQVSINCEQKKYQEFHGCSMISLKDAERMVEAFREGRFEEAVDQFRADAEAIESDDVKRQAAARKRAMFVDSLEGREKDMALWDGQSKGPIDTGAGLKENIGLDELRDIYAKQPLSCIGTIEEMKYIITKVRLKDRDTKFVISDKPSEKGCRYAAIELDSIKSECDLEKAIVNMCNIVSSTGDLENAKVIECRDVGIIGNECYFNILKLSFIAQEPVKEDKSICFICPFNLHRGDILNPSCSLTECIVGKSHKEEKSKIVSKDCNLDDCANHEKCSSCPCFDLKTPPKVTIKDEPATEKEQPQPKQPELEKRIKEVATEASESISEAMKPGKHNIKVGTRDVAVPAGRPKLEKKVRGWFVESLPDACDHDGVPCSFTCACHVSHPCESCGKQWPCKNIHKGADGDYFKRDEKPNKPLSKEDQKIKDALLSECVSEMKGETNE